MRRRAKAIRQKSDSSTRIENGSILPINAHKLYSCAPIVIVRGKGVEFALVAVRNQFREIPFELAGQPEVELGYRLCLKFWGNGFAEEAGAAALKHGFGDLKLAKIMAFVLPQNRASVKLLEQLGFRYLRDFLHADLSHRLYEFASPQDSV